MRLLPSSERGSRTGVVRTELQSLVGEVDFVPERVARQEIPDARKLLDRDGAVILTGWPVEPDSVVSAAATMLGTRLREVEKIQERTRRDTALTGDAPSHGLLHRDGAHLFVNINDRLVPMRDPDPDYVLIFCASPAPAGGESVVVDAYRLIERLRDSLPQLYKFLTTVDVNIAGKFIDPDIPYSPPSICRIVEWTRGGRMVVRDAALALPLPGEPQGDEHEEHIQTYVDVCATLAAQIREDTTLRAGEVLVVDNYRCLHGVRDHEGSRTTYVLRCRSKDAR